MIANNTGKVRGIYLFDVDMMPEEAFFKRFFNVFVVTVPRSGSTIACKVVEALGVTWIHNDENETIMAKRVEQMRKRYSETPLYSMQPADEFREVNYRRFDVALRILSTPYSGCKMLVNSIDFGLLKWNPETRVILMHRDPEEILCSQEAAYLAPVVDRDERRDLIRSMLVNAQVQLEEAKVKTLHVEHRELMTAPMQCVTKIAEFINAPNDPGVAAALVDANQHRFKVEECGYQI